uniref:Uncharacterized protein n=1 Tax=Solanum tuberosum TaxID=4113 RepID=M1DHQ0_SOLTU
MQIQVTRVINKRSIDTRCSSRVALIMPPQRVVRGLPSRKNVDPKDQGVPNAPKVQPQGEIFSFRTDWWNKSSIADLVSVFPSALFHRLLELTLHHSSSVILGDQDPLRRSVRCFTELHSSSPVGCFLKLAFWNIWRAE